MVALPMHETESLIHNIDVIIHKRLLGQINVRGICPSMPSSSRPVNETISVG